MTSVPMCAASESSAKLLVTKPPMTSATRNVAVSPKAHHNGFSYLISLTCSCPSAISPPPSSIANGDGLLDIADIHPASYGLARAPETLEDLHGLRYLTIFAEQFHLHFVDHLISEFHRVLLLACAERAQQPLDVKQA